MPNGIVTAIFIAPTAGAPMLEVEGVKALRGLGLEGDRYATQVGSFNKGRPGKRQVTLIRAEFIKMSSFKSEETRRNIVISGTPLMELIGKEFRIGEAVFRGVKYCDPCKRPSKLAGTAANFAEEFSDRGGLVAEIIVEGLICKGDHLIPPPKGY